MNNPPKTLEQARFHWYGRKDYFNPKGRYYQEGKCAYEVSEPPYYLNWHQCPRKNGHGIAGLYCKQHALIIERMVKDE